MTLFGEEHAGMREELLPYEILAFFTIFNNEESRQIPSDSVLILNGLVSPCQKPDYSQD